MKKIISLFMAVFILMAAFSTSFAAEGEEPESVKPSGLLFKEDGTLLITDLYSKSLWSQKDGVIKRLTGSEDILDLNGIPVGGYQDGAAKEALFESPWAIAPYKNGVAITDTDNHVLRFYDGSTVSTLAGRKVPAFRDGNGTEAAFNRPTGLAADGKGNLYIADTDNHVIRKMDANGNVTTFAGSVAGNQTGTALSAQFREPTGLCFANGALYVADTGNHRICKIENGQVTIVVGKTYAPQSEGFYQGGYQEGDTAVAQLSSPQGILVVNETIYIADSGNGAVRKLEKGIVSTILTSGSATSNLYPVSPRSIAGYKNMLFVSDVFANAIHVLEFSTAATPSKKGGQYFSAFGLLTKNSTPRFSGSTTGTVKKQSSLPTKDETAKASSAIDTSTVPALSHGTYMAMLVGIMGINGLQ